MDHFFQNTASLSYTVDQCSKFIFRLVGKFLFHMSISNPYHCIYNLCNRLHNCFCHFQADPHSNCNCYRCHEHQHKQGFIGSIHTLRHCLCTDLFRLLTQRFHQLKRFIQSRGTFFQNDLLCFLSLVLIQ